MSLQQHTCLTLVCDTCGDPQEEEDRGFTPHYDTAAAAKAGSTDPDGDPDETYQWAWNDDGTHTCPTCLVRAGYAACAADGGHQWDQDDRWQWCQRCGFVAGLSR